MYTFVELAARKRPKWVVWENVPGVLSSNKGGDFASFLGLLTGRDIQAPVGGWSNSGCIEGISSAYGVAWTMLDAQDFGVAQRRKRIFVIGYLGDWRPAAAVLFERNRLSGDTAKSREKRKATSSDAQGGVGGGGIPRVSGSLDTECGGGKLTHQSVNNGHLIPEPIGAFRKTKIGEYADDNTASTLCHRDYKDATDLVAHKPSWWNGEQTAATLTKQNANGAQRMPDKDNFGAVLEPTKWIPPNGEETIGTLSARDYKGIGNDDLEQGRGLAITQPVAHAFKVRGGSEDNTGEQGGTPGKKAGKGYLGQDEKVFTIGTTQDQQIAQPIAYENRPSDARVKPMGETCQTLTSRLGTGGGNLPLVQQPIAVDCYNQTVNEKTSQTIGSSASDVNHYGAVLQPTMAIRRLTPKECERLQGFPDDWTLIPYRNKSADLCPDGPRYKACGNSMAVPCMAWLGQRIQMVDDILNEQNNGTAAIPQL
jgi:DNA (cytosine-5)-methyltransferase 1